MALIHYIDGRSSQKHVMDRIVWKKQFESKIMTGISECLTGESLESNIFETYLDTRFKEPFDCSLADLRYYNAFCRNILWCTS